MGYDSELADDIPSAQTGLAFNTVVLWLAEWLAPWVDPQGVVVSIYDEQCPPALTPIHSYDVGWGDIESVFYHEIPGTMVIYEVRVPLPEAVTVTATMSLGAYVINDWGTAAPFCGFLSASGARGTLGCNTMYWDNRTEGFPRWALFFYSSYYVDLAYCLAWDTAADIGELAGFEQPQLFPVSPNPFNALATIGFTMPRSGRAAITIHDGRGRAVRRFDLQVDRPGEQTVRWDGRDRQGRSLPSGVYFCHLNVAGFEQTRRLTLVK